MQHKFWQLRIFRLQIAVALVIPSAIKLFWVQFSQIHTTTLLIIYICNQLRCNKLYDLLALHFNMYQIFQDCTRRVAKSGNGKEN